MSISGGQISSRSLLRSSDVGALPLVAQRNFSVRQRSQGAGRWPHVSGSASPSPSFNGRGVSSAKHSAMFKHWRSSIITFAVRKNSEARRHLSASFAVSAAKFFGLMRLKTVMGPPNFVSRGQIGEHSTQDQRSSARASRPPFLIQSRITRCLGRPTNHCSCALFGCRCPCEADHPTLRR